MPGKPAARLTDMTAHGGTITGPGVPTVMIGKMPAATLGDMHVCPMVTPATPPIPHVGGPITLGSTGVFIGKKPAARMGDMAMCVGPPSSIILGCMTVMIGEAGSGSQAGSAGSAAAASVRPPAPPKAVEAMMLSHPETSPTQAFEIQAIFQDKGKRPVFGVPYHVKDPDNAVIKGASGQDGTVRHGVYPKAGSYKLTLGTLGPVKWSSNPVEIGKESTLSSNTDADAGTEGFFFVSLVACDGSRHFIDRLEARVSSGKLEGKWTLEIELWKRLFEHSEAAFQGLEAVAMICESLAVSKVTPLDTSFKITVVHVKDKPLADHEVEIQQADGTTLKTRTDGTGKVKAKVGTAGVANLSTHKPGVSEGLKHPHTPSKILSVIDQDIAVFRETWLRVESAADEWMQEAANPNPAKPLGRVLPSVNSAKILRKGYMGEAVQELRIRLAGFGGLLPGDTFDDLTDDSVQQFEKDVMHRTQTGIVDLAFARALDAFAAKWTIDVERQLACPCVAFHRLNGCKGFGKGQFKGVYSPKYQKNRDEEGHQYEYPGIHRSLLWASRALMHYAEMDHPNQIRFDGFSSAYRCHVDNSKHTSKNKKTGKKSPRTTTNHMGKALDIHFAYWKNDRWNRGGKKDPHSQKAADEMRTVAQARLGAQMGWGKSNWFSMETADQGAVSWVHMDVRAWSGAHREDAFFTKTSTELNGAEFVHLISAAGAFQSGDPK